MEHSDTTVRQAIEELGEFSAADDALGRLVAACTNSGQLSVYNWVFVGCRRGDFLAADTKLAK
ncbi:hypothetical protein PQS31_00030 [Luteimonas sp BLCC-B24]|nr:hypothetical protein [Luteimonas sp. BLCC-B24]